MLHIGVVLNGERHALAVSPNLTLVEVLREDLLLTGTKEGCGVGECGACVVLLDGVPVTSCLVMAADVDERAVDTVEGLAANGELTRVQQAFLDKGALQCGFCTPGMVLTASALLRTRSELSSADIKDALGGVLCRCGAYPKIVEAVIAASGGHR